MKTIIVSGGTRPSKKLLENELVNSSYLICADSGANCLFDYGIIPDYIVGDLDSIDKTALEYFKKNNTVVLEYPPEKDYTDTELAFDTAFELGAKEIILLGSTGSRVDHMLGNLGMLLRCLKANISAKIRDDHNTIIIADKEVVIDSSCGKTFSLLAYFKNVHNLTIEGAKYPLRNFYLEIGNPITISNEFLEDRVKISFTEGILIVIFPRD